MRADRGIYSRRENSSFTPTKHDFDARYCYYRIFTNLREVGRSLQALTKQASDHVANRHRIFQGDLKKDLLSLVDYLEKISEGKDKKRDIHTVLAHSNEAIELIDHMQAELLRRIPNTGLSVRGSELYLNFLVFARELVNRSAIAAALENRLNIIVSNPSSK